MSSSSDQLSLGLLASVPRLPSDLRPMLPRPRDEPFDDPDWLFEPSWDGLRVLAHVEAGHLRLVDARGRDVTARFPDLLGLIDMVRGAPAILDGEIAIPDETGMPDPDALRRRLRSEQGERPGVRPGRRATYLADDLLVHEARSLLREPLGRRLKVLATAFRSTGPVVLVPAVAGEGRTLFEAIERQGLPAMLARQTDSPYLPGVRSELWRQVRTTRRVEVVVGGYAPRTDGSMNLLVGAWERRAGEDERFVAVGSVEALAGSELARALEPMLRLIGTAVTPFRRGAKAEYRWVRPDLVVTVEHRGWSDGRLVAPRLVAVREELDARTCHVPGSRRASIEDGEGTHRPLLALLQRLPLGEA